MKFNYIKVFLVFLFVSYKLTAQVKEKSNLKLTIANGLQLETADKALK